MIDDDWELPMPRQYLAMKYTVPPGACKCGECQLVPPEMLAAWDAEIKQLRATLKSLRVTN
jgi:hypothetical protein